jgi:hypothetical protein
MRNSELSKQVFMSSWHCLRIKVRKVRCVNALLLQEVRTLRAWHCMESRRSGACTPIPPIASTHDPFPASQKRSTGGGPMYAHPPLRLRVSPSCVNAAHMLHAPTVRMAEPLCRRHFPCMLSPLCTGCETASSQRMLLTLDGQVVTPEGLAASRSKEAGQCYSRLCD